MGDIGHKALACKKSGLGTAVRGLFLATLSLFLVSCAGKLPVAESGAVPDTAPEQEADMTEVMDPWESMNRATFWFNLKLDKYLLRPAAIGYRLALPGQVQNSVRNLLDNASSPVTFANDLFQGELTRSGITIGRLVTNSTVGIGGLFDVAEHIGLKKHRSDFGQTLALWGTGDGPYLMLPLLGPSNIRDGFGRAVDVFLDPLTYVYFFYDVEYGGAAQRALGAIDFRARNLESLDEMQATSVDYYAAVRSAYQQARRQRIYGESVSDDDFDDDFDYDE